MTEIFNNNSEFVVKMLIACLCGLIIGYERTNKNKEAGIRTHIIVALSSTVMVLVSKYGFTDTHADGSRIAAQIVSGVGFLGAGVIFVKEKMTVSGLTTAAGIWGTAGIGMAVGSGLYTVAIFASLLMVTINHYFKNPKFLTTNEYRVLMLELKVDIKNNNFNLEKFLSDNHFKLLSADHIIKNNIEVLQLKLHYLPDLFNVENLTNSLNAFGIDKFHLTIV